MKREMILEWAESLSVEQLRFVAVNAVEELVISEMVRLTAEGIPYWDATGDELGELPDDENWRDA